MYRDELSALQARIRTIESDLRAEQKRREAATAEAVAARAACDEAWVAARLGPGARRRRWAPRVAIGLLAATLAVSLVYLGWVRAQGEERAARLRVELARSEAAQRQAQFGHAQCNHERWSEQSRCACPSDAIPRGERIRRGHPVVVIGRPELRGAVDQWVLRRVILRHVNEVKYCYQKGLQERADLHDVDI